MGLVDYSDSDGSDTEAPAPAPAPKAPAPAKSAFQKVIDRNEPKKIKVELPSIKPEPGQQQDDEAERPAKRARTAGGGAFSGFNAMLPKPKGRVQSGPKAGVSLKTSSEAAFRRAPVGGQDGAAPNLGGGEAIETAVSRQEGEKKEEAKIVGKATKFKPLSVANNKKKLAKKTKPPEQIETGMKIANEVQAASAQALADANSTANAPSAPVPQAPKPKRSLFSVQIEEVEEPQPTNGDTYEAITTSTSTAQEPAHPTPSQPHQPTQPKDPNSLQSIASDLNLTPAQRRQLFGRNANNNADIPVAAHFNMDSEYAANEQARQSGDVVEHRAVKAIAPGKHSLQQLVNNARTQQGAMEDKWAEGRRERGEAGGKYGW